MGLHQHQHTNIPSFAKVPNPSIKMKSVAALALVALARASPMARDANDIAARDGHKMDDHKLEMAGPFTFTSTYNVIASPNQVVNSDNEFTGGLEGCIAAFPATNPSWLK